MTAQGRTADRQRTAKVALPPAPVLRSHWCRVRPKAGSVGLRLVLGSLVPWASASLATIGRFLSAWVRLGSYLEAVGAPGSRRVNLDGSDAGEVDDAHGARALEVLS